MCKGLGCLENKVKDLLSSYCVPGTVKTDKTTAVVKPNILWGESYKKWRGGRSKISGLGRGVGINRGVNFKRGGWGK